MKKLLEVQKEIGTLSKNSKNPFFKSSYLDLNDLLNEVTPLLNSNGMLLSQPIQDGQVCSIIYNAESGQEIVSSCIQLPNIPDPQKMGAAISYYRRYTLKSLLAISEEDTDGNGLSKAVKPSKPKLKKEQLEVLLSDGNLESLRTAVRVYNLTKTELTLLKDRANELKSK